MKTALAILAAAALLTPAGQALAHEGHAHKVMGTVVAADASHVEVETKDGKKASYLLSSDTKYLKTATAAPAEVPQPASAADLKAGGRVVLSVVEKNGKKTVTEVRIGQAGKADAAGHKH